MASESVKTGGLALTRNGREHRAKEQQKNVPEKGLVLAFVVLLVWALYVAFDGVSLLAIGHTIKALLAAVF